MSIRLAILSMLMLASVHAGGFLEPDPDFFHGFWKVLLVESELEPKSTLAEKELLSPMEEKTIFEAPTPSSVVWWFGVAAGMALFGAIIECIVLLRELLLGFQMNRALKQGCCNQVQKLLQRKLGMPPGSTLTELAAKVEDTLLEARILACEKARYMQEQVAKNKKKNK